MKKVRFTSRGESSQGERMRMKERMEEVRISRASKLLMEEMTKQ